MTDRDRLVDVLQNSRACVWGTCGKCEHNGKDDCLWYMRADCILADGWIRPPLSLNQIVWCKSFDGINQCKVSSLTQKADGSFKIRLTNLVHKFVFEITPDKIGKTVFLTKEEAERELEKRNGNGTT